MRILDFFRKLNNPAAPEQIGPPEEATKMRMGVVKQDFLCFREGNSDKVYHLEMRTAGEGLYTVHFEYGRREAALQSGTKTPEPLGLEAAEKIYAALLNEKTKKGYRVYGGPQGAVTRSYRKKDPAARNRAVLGHLALAAQSPQKQAAKNWRLSRVIWRAGELRLPDALPHLAAILHHPAPENPAMTRYCTLWAIARCATVADEVQKTAVSTALRALLAARPDALNDGLLCFACAAVFPDAERAALREKLIQKLPPSFQHDVRQNQGERLCQTLQDYAENRPKSHFSFVETLYALAADQPSIRPALLWFARNAPFKPGFFNTLRHLFKMAEMRADAGLFGILSQRFVLETAAFSARPAGQNLPIHLDGKWEVLDPQTELAKPDSRLAFSDKTRQWFIRRSLQTLLATLEHEDDTYVKMAAGILLAFDDARHTSREGSETRYFYNAKTERWDDKKTIYPAYGEFTAFFYILNGENRHYTLQKNETRWGISENNHKKQRQEKTPQCHEPHAERWDACPQAYVHLLAESKSALVQAFALRRFEAHPRREELTARFDTLLIIKILNNPHLPSALFALRLAEARFEPQNPDRELILSMLESPHQPVCQKGHEWLQADLAAFSGDTNFIFRLLTHREVIVRIQARQSMPLIAAMLTEAQQQALVGRILSYLLSLEGDAARPAPGDTPQINELIKNLRSWAEGHLLQLSPELLTQLLIHPLEANARLGAQLIAQRPYAPEALPDSTFQTLLEAKSETIRAFGTAILEKIPAVLLVPRLDLLTALLAGKYPDLRESVRAALLKVIASAPVYGEQVLGRSLRILLNKESFEGLHLEIQDFTMVQLAEFLPKIERKTIFRLLNSDHVAANNLAALLIERFVEAESLSVRNIVRFGDHEVAAVRQICRRMFVENAARMRYEREDALRLLESEWDDTRAFAFDYFRREYSERDWTPERMIGICDSVRPDVQALGRELVGRYLRDEDGPESLLRLAQHPKPEMQAFAAQYLEKYAADNPERLDQLKPYCITVLTQVNKNRKAKNKIFDFLEREAKKSAQAARIVSAIVDHVSLTTVAADKERCIALSVDLEIHAEA
jgi:predicted DNA-binding WGR domain protein